ncbi:uncharacterized protein E5676_scaffold242G00310 [Cucumis melo var. makuwa]|uniref:Uncharacterized protein n=1 Tax=Cucumis melo var. makuwa TaxID=1194695 RepID=A0A5D3D7Y2_CUCMM|nr:uncharacterized protein E5676_scaffold242G00310 [Cucumis melo var. makuwa]
MQQGARCATIRQVGRRYCDPVELGTHKSKDHLDTSNIGRPLSMGVHFKPEQELLRQAHRYVLENTIDVQPYMDGYAINGCRYHTKSCEKDRSVQNSGVSLVAKTMQVSSSKDKNPIIGDMSFYGNSGGVRIDELGYTLVDLNRVGHKSDSFILASQAKQVFYVEDPSDVRWSVVLTPPQRDFEDRYNDDELGDTILQCEGIPNDMPNVNLNNDLDDSISTYKESSNEVYVDRAKMWKKARVNKQGQYDNDDIQQVVHKIDEISMNTDSSSVNRHCLNDVLTQALGTKEHNGRVRGVGGYVTSTTRVSELEAQIRSNLSTPLSAHGSCSRPIMLEGIEEKGKRIEVESLEKPKENEKKGKEAMKVNEPELDVLKERDLMKMPTKKEVVCESTSTLPLALKLILRYVEKVMEKDSSITFSLPADLFGISQTSVLREDIIDLCNMNEVKMFTLVAYMIYFYSSVIGSKEDVQYVFIDPSLISSGNIQESRIRNLCSRLMVSKAHQVVLAPFNPGGHWALLALNAYEDTVFYLDSLRTTSKATTRYVTDTSTTCGYYVMKYMREIVNRGSIVISDSIDTRKSYSQAELDEVRVELVEFLGSYI